MNGKTRRMISILLAALLMLMLLALAGCSKGQETAEVQDTQTDEQQDEQTDEQTDEQIDEQQDTDTDEQSDTQELTQIPEDFDIAANLQLANGVDGKGGNIQVVDTDHFTLTLTHGGSWFYEVDSKTSITIYNVASREADCGGRLFSIVAFPAGNKEYEMLPSYSVIGERNGIVYVAEYPTDVQADVSSEEAMADYQAVYEEVNKIRKGAEDSPLELK